MAAKNRQVGGDHYHNKGLQPWDVIDAWGLGYYDGNVIKYLARWQDKGGIEDLRKAQHYLEKFIESVESEQAQDAARLVAMVNGGKIA